MPKSRLKRKDPVFSFNPQRLWPLSNNLSKLTLYRNSVRHISHLGKCRKRNQFNLLTSYVNWLTPKSLVNFSHETWKRGVYFQWKWCKSYFRKKKTFWQKNMGSIFTNIYGVAFIWICLSFKRNKVWFVCGNQPYVVIRIFIPYSTLT